MIELALLAFAADMVYNTIYRTAAVKKPGLMRMELCISESFHFFSTSAV